MQGSSVNPFGYPPLILPAGRPCITTCACPAYAQKRAASLRFRETAREKGAAAATQTAILSDVWSACRIWCQTCDTKLTVALVSFLSQFRLPFCTPKASNMGPNLVRNAGVAQALLGRNKHANVMTHYVTGIPLRGNAKPSYHQISNSSTTMLNTREWEGGIAQIVTTR